MATGGAAVWIQRMDAKNAIELNTEAEKDSTSNEQSQERSVLAAKTKNTGKAPDRKRRT
jgi:hypothetical protein